MSRRADAARGRSTTSRFVAGRRKAEQDRKAPATRAEWAETRAQQRETRKRDAERIRLMARFEPARYLMLAEQGLVTRKHVRDVRRRAAA